MTIQTKALFITLLVISTLIEWTYKFGVAARPYLIKAAAISVVLALYTYDAARWVYANREAIRHRVEDAFVYRYDNRLQYA